MSQALAEEFILGTYDHTLDDKGRMILPAAYRDRFLDGVHLTTGPENTVQVWDIEGFRAALHEVMTLPTGSALGRRRRRAITAATIDTPDAQGRILIPKPLREAAGLVRELTVIGNGDHFEVWARDRWQAYQEETNRVFGDDFDDPGA